MKSELLFHIYGSEWRQHPEFKNYYLSRDGRCASFIKSEKPAILIGCTCAKIGYRAVTFHSEGLKYRKYLHRTICEIFNGPANGLPQCRHLDGDPTNNSAINLAWGTAKQNMQDMRAHGRTQKWERNSQAKLNETDVQKMREIRKNTGAYYHSIAKQFGVSAMTALRAIKGESWV